MLIVRWIATIISLPGTVLIVVPSAVLWLSKGYDTVARPDDFLFWLSLVLGALGIVFAFWAMGFFFRFGNGTAAPWDPPRNFVVRGPYCYVRNPMITSALTILLAESLLFQSLIVFIWFVLFLVLNLIYIPTIEEKQLVKRFGRDYLTYKNNVPRWIPRARPWSGASHRAANKRMEPARPNDGARLISNVRSETPEDRPGNRKSERR